MRATLTVNAQESPSKPYKVTLKLRNVPRARGRQVARLCGRSEGSTFRCGLLSGKVDVFYNPGEKSVTLVKPAHDAHGLQKLFDELVGKSLTYRIREARDAACKQATTGSKEPYEGNLQGCSAEEIFQIILRAMKIEAAPPASARKPRKRRVQRPVGVPA